MTKKQQKNKYNFHESGKTHDKLKHIGKKYYEEMDRVYTNHVHRFNPSTGLCIHCLLHRDEIFLTMIGELPSKFKDKGSDNGSEKKEHTTKQGYGPH